ncbi:MAG: serine/threonine protein kinase [Gemmataceae bacterium]
MSNAIFLGKYQAIRLLGEGGMGRVFLGQHLEDGSDVVIKLMHDHIAQNPRFRQGFQREMRLMMRFRHPYSVSLYDASVDDATPCIVMEYVPGVTLHELVTKYARLNPEWVGHLLGQLCEVLYAAHGFGIVHRDLTPANVMVMDPGTAQEMVKVMDFGLARMGVGPYIPLEKLTGDGSSIGGGTPDYVPPEQVRGEEVDHRGDIYSIGVLLFKVLTGYLPFEDATTTSEILDAHVNRTPPSFGEMGANDILPAIEEVVLCCLSKDPADRPQDALELAELYQGAMGHRILAAEPVPGELLPETVSVHDRINPRTVVDHLEAWMPEPIAIIKLRGFVEDKAGEFIESEPGIVRFRLADPASPPEQPKSFLSIFGLGPKTTTVVEHVLVELRLEKSQEKNNLINIAVMMKPEADINRLDDPEWKDWCQTICRDLRGYLISR